jgi:hypothetical protein
MFKATVKLLAARHARTCFVHVNSNSTNEYKKQASSPARTALKLRVPKDREIFSASEIIFPPSTRPVIALNGKHKVYTDLPEVSPSRPKKWQTGGDEDDVADRNSNHRGRAKVHELQAGLRKELLACKDHKEFRNFFPKRTDPRTKKAKVSLQDLSDDFEARLDYPAVAPVSFNADQLAFNKRMADELRQPLADTSPRQSYSRDITIEEIEAVKRHIKAHGQDTTVGCDDFTYKECLAIPNEKMLELGLPLHYGARSSNPRPFYSVYFNVQCE